MFFYCRSYDNLGTLFLLAILAVAQLRTYVRHKEITHEVVMRINHLLRCPKPSMLILSGAFALVC